MSSSNQFVEKVAAQIAPLLPVHSRILIGLSGGVDSVVLLHLLNQFAPKFSWQLSALHVHHGISPNADAWVKFCMELCANYAIPLVIEHVDIAPLREHGIEAAARKLRHAAFAKQPCDVVVLAHHADDQSETLLLQLLRGAGVRGASAMPQFSGFNRNSVEFRPVRADGTTSHSTKSANNADQVAGYELVEANCDLATSHPSTGSGRTDSVKSTVRPLLHCSRHEILNYAAEHRLQWMEDESNADDSYPRNSLRHRVLPLLGEKFPAYRDTLARSAQHFAEANSLLDELAQQDAVQAIAGETMAVTALQSLTPPRAKNLLRYFLHRLGATMPQAVQIDEMLQQLCNARDDAAVCISFGDWQVRRYQGKVYVLCALGEFDKHIVMSWHGEAQLIWPALNTSLQFKHTQGVGISLGKLQHASVTLRLRQGGETLRPHPKAATRTLKNLLQEHHIPPWQRDRLPLLYCGEELVCVVGVAIAAAYQAAGDEAGISVNF
ncbi:MAG: tRNA lysidine(34) synthetase TilS [Gallionella sp.]|nr:tRNA lysidine(34) synthetase TilS [Gallionella sp.]